MPDLSVNYVLVYVITWTRVFLLLNGVLICGLGCWLVVFVFVLSYNFIIMSLWDNFAVLKALWYVLTTWIGSFIIGFFLKRVGWPPISSSVLSDSPLIMASYGISVPLLALSLGCGLGFGHIKMLRLFGRRNIHDFNVIIILPIIYIFLNIKIIPTHYGLVIIVLNIGDWWWGIIDSEFHIFQWQSLPFP